MQYAKRISALSTIYLSLARKQPYDVEGIADIDKQYSVKNSDKEGISGSGYDPIGKIYHMFM